jgi:hypothetical protein
MRNYRDLQVWEKAHKLDPRDLPGTYDFPKEERFGPDQPDPAFVCLDRSKLGGRLWQKIRRRDARFIPDFNGFGIGAFLSPATRSRLRSLEEYRIFQVELRSGGSHENAIFTIPKD